MQFCMPSCMLSYQNAGTTLILHTLLHFIKQTAEPYIQKDSNRHKIVIVYKDKYSLVHQKLIQIQIQRKLIQTLRKDILSKYRNNYIPSIKNYT
jgi:PHD/YefM family antitoxin component YafN of YafNO toxin-antitoxin module